jgi:hypothetical protein
VHGAAGDEAEKRLGRRRPLPIADRIKPRRHLALLHKLREIDHVLRRRGTERDDRRRGPVLADAKSSNCPHDGAHDEGRSIVRIHLFQ